MDVKRCQRNREIEHKEWWVRAGVEVISRDAERHPAVGVYTHSGGQTKSRHRGWGYIHGSEVESLFLELTFD